MEARLASVNMRDQAKRETPRHLRERSHLSQHPSQAPASSLPTMWISPGKAESEPPSSATES